MANVSATSVTNAATPVLVALGFFLRRWPGWCSRVGALLSVFGLAVVGCLWFATAAPVGAHSDLIRATPPPGLETGPFDEVRLEFLDPILATADISIDLRDFDGVLLEGYIGEARFVNETTIAAPMQKQLPEGGQYLVFYMIETNDSDGIQEAGYEFLFDPDSGVEFGFEQGASTAELLGYMLIAVGVIGLLFWLSPWRPGRKSTT